MDQNQKQQAVEQLRSATTILVTTSNNPSVDQIAAALGISKMLQKLNKSVTTVITSPLPGNIKFLKIEDDLSDNLDSLRDFIVSLDKNLADKLRYKVEGDEVRIFITPYHAQIKKEDIRFSQGDFNVDAVVVLGTINRADIDAAILAQSRVLSETSVISVTAGTNQSSIGGINWHDPQAGSVSEMIVSVSEALQPGLLDSVSSNILLTGIIAATNHFSNPDTSPKVMTMAAQLMAAGADQQTIMRELKGVIETNNKESIAKQSDSDKSIELKDEATDKKSTDHVEAPVNNDDSNIKIDHNVSDASTANPAPVDEPKMIVGHEKNISPIAAHSVSVVPADSVEPVAATLSHPAANNDSTLDDARAAVEAAVATQPAGTPLNPVASLGTRELTPEVHLSATPPTASVAPQLGTDLPKPTPGAISPTSSNSNTGAVTGAVNPSQLYPDVASPYDSAK